MQRKQAQEGERLYSSGPVCVGGKYSISGQSPSKLHQEQQVHKSGCGELSS